MLPDVQVTLQDGEFVIMLNDEVIPVLGINPLFEEMAKGREKTKDPKTRQFVTQNLQDARWFIRTIGQRNETLLKVCRAIVEFQREFFLKGPKYLKPLTLKDIAGEIGVHEATVSRITSSKYIQTEWGIFALKHFFSNSVAGTGERRLAVLEGGREGDHTRDHRAGGRGHAFRPEDRRDPGCAGRLHRPQDGRQVPGRAGHRFFLPEETHMNIEIKGIHLEVTERIRRVHRPEDAPPGFREGPHRGFSARTSRKEKNLFKVDATVNFRWGSTTTSGWRASTSIKGIDDLFDKLEPRSRRKSPRSRSTTRSRSPRPRRE